MLLKLSEVEEEYERDWILDEAEENIDRYQELQSDYFDKVIDEVSEANKDSEAEDENVFKPDEINKEEESVTKDDSKTIEDEEDITDKTSTNQVEEENDDTDKTPTQQESIPRMQQEIKSELDGGYWEDGIAGALLEAEDKAAKLLKSYSEMNASLATPQYGFVKGLKIFGNAGYDAAQKELEENLIGRNCIRMLKKNEVISQIRTDALGYLLFLKQKWCGKVKARGCVDGRPQRLYITKEQSTTPTISLHTLMGTCLVNALEGRKVMTVNVPGAFLQANLEEGEDYYVKFTGEMVKMLCRTDALYCDQIIHDKKGRKYLYSKLTKAVYGTLIGLRRWFDKLTTALREWGFEPNKYDECC